MIFFFFKGGVLQLDAGHDAPALSRVEVGEGGGGVTPTLLFQKEDTMLNQFCYRHARGRPI